jgi:hypothetical protein
MRLMRFELRLRGLPELADHGLAAARRGLAPRRRRRRGGVITIVGHRKPRLGPDTQKPPAFSAAASFVSGTIRERPRSLPDQRHDVKD